MTSQALLFSVDTEKLSKFKLNYLKSIEGIDAIKNGLLNSDERLFLSLISSDLLNTTTYSHNKTLIKRGEQFDDAYFIVNGEIDVQQGDKLFKLGAGSILGLAEGMVELPSRYTAITASSVQLKIIPFHKVDNIVNILPADIKSILVTIIKRNLTLT
jgi:CRP-like cAMP-binding protein